MKKIISSILIFVLIFSFGVLAAPIISNVTAEVPNDEVLHFTAEMFAEKFIDTEALIGIKINQLPTQEQGVLNWDTSPYIATKTIQKEDIPKLSFTPKSGFLGDISLEWVGENSSGFHEESAQIVITVTEKIPTPTPTPEPVPSIYFDMMGHWGEYTSAKLYEKNIWIGEKIGEKRYFRPDVNIDRIDFLLTLLSAIGANYDVLESTDVIFADEEELPMWVKLPAKWAYQKGIISGSLENEMLYLHPYNTITRAEAAKIINNALKLSVPPENQNEDFADQDTLPLWAVEEIRTLHAYNIIQGFEDKTFRPYNQITRIQAGEMMWQVYMLVTEQPEARKIR